MGFSLLAADDAAASITLTVTASTNDNGSIATSAAQTITLAVNPVAETPILSAAAAANNVNEDGTVGLTITATPAESGTEDPTTDIHTAGPTVRRLHHGNMNHD